MLDLTLYANAQDLAFRLTRAANDVIENTKYRRVEIHMRVKDFEAWRVGMMKGLATYHTDFYRNTFWGHDVYPDDSVVPGYVYIETPEQVSSTYAVKATDTVVFLRKVVPIEGEGPEAG